MGAQNKRAFRESRRKGWKSEDITASTCFPSVAWTGPGSSGLFVFRTICCWFEHFGLYGLCVIRLFSTSFHLTSCNPAPSAACSWFLPNSSSHQLPPPLPDPKHRVGCCLSKIKLKSAQQVIGKQRRRWIHGGRGCVCVCACSVVSDSLLPHGW